MHYLLPKVNNKQAVMLLFGHLKIIRLDDLSCYNMYTKKPHDQACH